MKIGDFYAFIDRIEESQPVRILVLCTRVDNLGIGLEPPQLTATCFPTAADAVHQGAIFEAGPTILYPFGSNYANTFEPLEEPE